MSYELKPQNIVSINPVRFETDGDTVTGLKIEAEVNYGSMGISHTINLWEHMGTAQRQRAQRLYDELKGAVESIVME